MKQLASILISMLLAAGGVTAQAQETNSEPGQDLKSFDIVFRKNIFDQSRTGIRSLNGPRRQAPRVERLTLEGIGGNQSDPEAIFGGVASSDRPLKVGDHVSGFELSQITPDCVKLTNSTNVFVLDFANRRSLRRVDNGPWEGSGDQSEPVNTSTNTTDVTAAAATASAVDAAHPGESAIERRLRLRREQEEK
jgi:hypothetical protein